jgi:glutaredoxin 2
MRVREEDEEVENVLVGGKDVPVLLHSSDSQ